MKVIKASPRFLLSFLGEGGKQEDNVGNYSSIEKQRHEFLQTYELDVDWDFI